MGDELANFDGIDKVSICCLAKPAFDRRHSWPGIEGGIDLYRFEQSGIVTEPVAGGRFDG